MASNDSAMELEVEERLFFAVVHGSLGESECLLRDLEDVNARGARRRTLLHVAARLGRLDWVETLLRIGADPGVRDADDSTALDAALEMFDKHPDDVDRRIILGLMRLVQEREHAGRDGSTRRRDTPRVQDSVHPEPDQDSMLRNILHVVSRLSVDIESIKETQDELRKEMESTKNVLSQHFLSSPAGSSKNESIESLHEDTSFLKECVNGMSSQVTSLSCDQNATKRQLCSLKEKIDDVKRGLTSRDAILDALEVSVTSMAEEWLPFKKMMKKVSAKVTEVSVERPGQGFNGSTPGILQRATEEVTRSDCIEAMMRKTEISQGSDGRVSQIREIYEKLYSTSCLTSSILSFLQFQPRVRIVVGGDPGGRESNGRSGGRTVVDLKGSKVCLGGLAGGNYNEEYVAGDLAWSLAQVAIFLAFENGGRPYFAGDGGRGQQFRRILEEADGKRRTGGVDLGWYIIDALNEGDQVVKETELAAAVPGIIALYGLKWGTSQLRRKLPSLLDFYENHVATTLSGYSKVSLLY